MSGIGEIMKALKDAILLTERVQKLAEDTTALARAIREEAQHNRREVAELRDRVTRLEARLDTLLDIIKIRATIPTSITHDVQPTLMNPHRRQDNEPSLNGDSEPSGKT